MKRFSIFVNKLNLFSDPVQFLKLSWAGFGSGQNWTRSVTIY